MEIGMLCVKLAGRDANQKCIVIDNIDEKNVLIDGNTRRKKVNVKHLLPMNKILKIKKGASTEDVHKLFESEGITILKVKIGAKRERKAPKVEKTTTKAKKTIKKKE